MKKLFVRNIPFDLTEESFKEVFEQAGTVEKANIVMDKMTGRPRGFGFVEMSTDEEAQEAVDKINGQSVGGRDIVVDFARDNDRSRDDRRSNYSRNR